MRYINKTHASIAINKKQEKHCLGARQTQSNRVNAGIKWE
jgi:hypothetical protein